MKAVIDSDVLIDFLQGFEKARLELARYRSPLYSVISWMEVMGGAESKEEREAAEGLFASMQRVDLTGKVAAQAVRERCQRGLKLPDAVILATADTKSKIGSDY